MRFVPGSLDLKTFLSHWRPRGPEFLFPRTIPLLALGFFFPRWGPGFFLFSVMGLTVRRLRFLYFLSADVTLGPSVLPCP